MQVFRQREQIIGIRETHAALIAFCKFVFIFDCVLKMENPEVEKSEETNRQIDNTKSNSKQQVGMNFEDVFFFGYFLPLLC